MADDGAVMSSCFKNCSLGYSQPPPLFMNQQTSKRAQLRSHKFSSNILCSLIKLEHSLMVERMHKFNRFLRKFPSGVNPDIHRYLEPHNQIHNRKYSFRTQRSTADFLTWDGYFWNCAILSCLRGKKRVSTIVHHPPKLF